MVAVMAEVWKLHWFRLFYTTLRNQAVFSHKPVEPIEVANTGYTFVQELNNVNPKAKPNEPIYAA